MAKGEDTKSEMALARQSDGINVIFDQNSPPSPCSRSRTSSDSSCSSTSGSYRGRGNHRARYRSSSSSSSKSSSSNSRSSPRARSRSHPRCHRRSSRCRCDNHRRHGRGRHHCSPPRHYRAHSRSYSRSPLPDRHSRRRQYRSRSKSSRGLRTHRRAGSQSRCQVPRSPPRSCRSRSRSRSSGRSASLSLDDKRELLKAAAANAVKILGLEKLEVPESVKPIVPEQRGESPVSETWVRQDPEKTPSESSDVEPDASSPKMSPKRRIISFSINNSVAKPTVAPSCAKVTPRMDIYESRKPYGHWVPVRSRKTSSARKHTLNTSH